MYRSEAEALRTHGIPPEDLESEFEQLSVAFWEKSKDESELNNDLVYADPPLLPDHRFNRSFDVLHDRSRNYKFVNDFYSKERYNRAADARSFRKRYKFVEGKKYCITSYKSNCSWSDKCYDSTWVAVHGMDSVCVVTWRRDVDITRVGYRHYYSRNQQPVRLYAEPEAATSEVECLPYDDDYREMFGQSFEKPFSIVSVVSDTKRIHEESAPNEASSAEYDEEKATAFLKRRMKSDLAFTSDETIQTAISGFQHLCLEELKAEDIWVTTLMIENGSYYKHLDNDQIKEHLAVINGGSSSSGGSGPSLESDESPL